jgi:membrane-bound lytic murein transglycosylase B
MRAEHEQGKSNMLKRALLLAVVSILSSACQAQQHPGAEAFAEKAAAEHGLDPAAVTALLEDARFKQSIVDAMTRPAEGKDWFEYRPIFLTDKRIEGGVEFWRENAELIRQAAERFEVDPEVIVAIIGVETFYGRITGGYRVLDALTTLSFYYPAELRDRSEFFSNELMDFLLLGQEEGLPLRDVEGSYAGAMGLGQFMPSSYLEYAVDLDGDGRRDLWDSLADVIGSVANYLHRHGWQPGQPVASRAGVSADADMELVSRSNLKPGKTVAELAGSGFVPVDPVPSNTPGAVTRLREEAGDSYWLTFQNFYVITRYNRSPLYAMAVHDLSQAILAAYEDA